MAYGRGGTEPTVTDANLVLGRISDGAFLSGRLRLDRAASAAAIETRVARPLEYEGETGRDIAAQGILELSAAAMAGAIKEITIERGLDVRDFTLMVFGGGGPLFGLTLARQLHIPTVVVPPHPGNFSTIGMLIAGARIDLARTLVSALSDDALSAVDHEFNQLEQSARTTMAAELQAPSAYFEHWLEARYRGQTHTVRAAYAKGKGAAAFRESFEETYRRRFGHLNADCDVEVLGLRLGSETWLGLLGPAGMPPAVSGRLNAELIRILQIAEFREKVLNTGNEPVGLGLAAFQAQMAQELDGYIALAKSAAIKAQ